MSNTETVNHANTDIERLQLLASQQHEDVRVFIDPAFPDYMARRNDYFPKVEPADEEGKWRLAPDAVEWPGLSVAAVTEITALTETEFGKLAECGLHTPERSTYIITEETGILGDQRATSYNYTRLIEGELLDAARPEHIPYALEYARAAIQYLMVKSPGDLIFSDLLARNCMIGIQMGAEPNTSAALYLIDTEPAVEPVEFDKQAGYADNYGRPAGPLTEPSSYAYRLLDLRDLLSQIPQTTMEVQLEVATLLHKTSVQLSKCGI